MEQRKPKILVFEFHQETNTFNPVVTSFDRFQHEKIFEGDKRYAECLALKGCVSGTVAAIEEAGGEVIPAVFLHASSGGRVDDEVMAYVCSRLTHYVETFGPVDGVCADLHGATCCETIDDACGHLLTHLRSLVGNVPISVAMDLHANVTDRVLAHADFICGYNSYPHVDFYQTGHRAGKFLMERIQKGRVCVMAASKMKLLIPPSGYNSLEGAFHHLMERGKAMVAEGRIRDFTLFPVQPWLDIADLVSRVVTIGEDAEEALRCADELAQALYDLRHEAMPELYTVDEILDFAEANTGGKPVILAYPADSPNGGAVGDSPVVAMRVWERKSSLYTLMFVVDPATAEYAHKLGVGATAEFSIGAGYTKGMPGPFCAEGRVRSLHDGSFRTAMRATYQLGRTAVLSFGNMDIVVCSRCSVSGSPMLFKGMGLEPSLYQLVVVKANTSFRAPYAPISDLVYVADAPGAGAPNLKAMPWDALDMAQFPFVDPVDYAPEQAKLW